MELIAEHRLFAGRQLRYRHDSECCQCPMVFSVYLPPDVHERPVPVLYWLSGLTCSDENFSTKAGAQRVAAELGMALVMPDTSPRGNGVPDDPEGGWDFGLGAGFYLNATQAPWQQHYQMYDYVVKELPELIEAPLSLDGERRCISGHSMGGHGALTIGLKNRDRYRSISAFSPIVAPSQVPWGKKAFTNYLGEDESLWKRYDACELLSTMTSPPLILVDQGEADEFLKQQLQTWRLEEAVQTSQLHIRYRPGYNHSYWFICSFIEDHLRFHYAAVND